MVIITINQIIVIRIKLMARVKNQKIDLLFSFSLDHSMQRLSSMQLGSPLDN